MRSDQIKKGVERAPHRALLRATGVGEKDFDKPFVAVVNSYVDIVPGHVHLHEFGRVVKEAVRAIGMVPFEFNTIGVDDGIAMGHGGMKFSLPSRELIADCVETMLSAHCFDGMVCIPNCDKIVPGMLMAAARLDVPTVFVSGGAMAAGRTPDGEVIDLATVFEGVARAKVGGISLARLQTLEEHACPTCGSCSGMLTANSMNCLMEALGIALPFNGSALARTPEREKLARGAVGHLRELIETKTTARMILTREAFDDAFALDVAMGGSTNTVLHTLAIAREAGIAYPLARINEIADRVPYPCKVAPAGKYHMEDVHRAGGVPAILKELTRIPGLLHTARGTVTGKTLGENVAFAEIHDKDVIRSLETAYSAKGGLAVLFGNLAPEGSVVKTGAVDPKMKVHSGPARVFEGHDEAVGAIDAGQIHAGDVVITRYEGPAGGPGMQEMLAPTSAIMGGGLGETVALVPPGESPAGGRVEGGTRPIGGSRLGCESTSEARREGLVPLQTRLVPSGRREATEAGNRRPNFCRTVLVTDGRFSGATRGACIGHVSPEAAARGPIAAVREGDIVDIDLNARRLNVRLSDDKIRRRLAALPPFERAIESRWLRRYAKLVTSAGTGAVLKDGLP